MSEFDTWRHRWDNQRNISDLVGLTLTKVTINKDEDEILFETEEGRTFKMYHEQNCCEGVHIESIDGEIGHLVGHGPVTMAEEVTSSKPDEAEQAEREKKKAEDEYYWEPESETWTFYKIGTRRDVVTLRWWGSSNGYYSEDVSFIEVTPRSDD